ncbi:MAG TPA: adenosylmethionine decarboxylase [Longimicrobium sp.]|jgi:S-adenosylmethionine decarboxylase|uniref:adenosylmethionine decarboxylase n=1 Tax=Longimicrobium sp. TaxID=2029185 RepID=UPI002ED9DCF7
MTPSAAPPATTAPVPPHPYAGNGAAVAVEQEIFDAYGCECPLDDPVFLAGALERAVLSVHATVVDRVVHHFVPHGVTVVLVLAESHAVLSTWPEHGYANVAIFLCNPEMPPARVWAKLRTELRPAHTVVHLLRHEIGPAPAAAAA